MALYTGIVLDEKWVDAESCPRLLLHDVARRVATGSPQPVQSVSQALWRWYAPRGQTFGFGERIRDEEEGGDVDRLT